MPVPPLIASGVGFAPGSVRYLPTLGLTPAAAATELTITCSGLPHSIHVCVEVASEAGWTDTVRGGYVEVFVGGQWHRGTALYPTSGLDELHAIILGLTPNTKYFNEFSYEPPE